MKKNAVQGTLGTLPGFWGVINGNYERLISEKKKGLFKSYWFRAGAGLYVEWGGEGGHFVTGLTGLTGSNKNHLELNVGLALLFPNFPYEYAGPHPIRVNPAGVIGYRFQKPQGKFVFRFGVGYPEAWYLSLGLVF